MAANNLTNIKYYQAFSSVDFLGVMALLSLVVLISWPILARQMGSEKVAAARQEAERIATQDLRISELNKTSRTPSSEAGPESQIHAIQSSVDASWGKDPWNHPYHLRILHNSYGQEVYRVVWSAGPDGVNDTEGSILYEKIRSHESQIFGGDDVGFVEKIR